MKNKIAVVTGASSGIGRCTAKALSENGCKVYDLSRRNVPAENITNICTDVTDTKQVARAIKKSLTVRAE